jgi:hypothetical protein
MVDWQGMARRAKKRGKHTPSKETHAPASPGRIRLEKELEVELPAGSVVKLRPGPYKKGIAVVPISSGGAGPNANGTGGGRSGRKPRAGTVRLRGRLQKDVQQSSVQKPKVYVEWLMGIDPGLSVSSARQIVYRERRIALEGE